MEKITIKDMAAHTLEVWKKDVKQYISQMKHNREEGEAAFEDQKKALGHLISDVKHKFEKLGEFGEEKTLKIRENLDELRVQAALAKMDSRDALHDQQEKLNLGLHNLKYNISKVEKEAEGDVKLWLENARTKFEGFQTKFDIFKAQFLEKSEGAKNNWNEKKTNITSKLNEINEKLEARKDARSERWEHFSEEMAEAWKHLKGAINS